MVGPRKKQQKQKIKEVREEDEEGREESKKIREEFDLLVWRPRKTSPHRASIAPWRGTLSSPLWPSA